jgi:hypothetical protein
MRRSSATGHRELACDRRKGALHPVAHAYQDTNGDHGNKSQYQRILGQRLAFPALVFWSEFVFVHGLKSLVKRVGQTDEIS